MLTNLDLPIKSPIVLERHDRPSETLQRTHAMELPLEEEVLDSRLRGPADVSLRTRHSPQAVADLLRQAIADEVSIEVEPSMASRRRLAGHVTGADVDLWVGDANWVTRRMPRWTLHFRGTLQPVPDGTVIEGSVDIRDRRSLTALVWMFRIVAVVIATLWLASAGAQAGGGVAIQPITLLVPIVVSLALILGSVLVVSDGERYAAADAELLIRFLEQALSAQPSAVEIAARF